MAAPLALGHRLAPPRFVAFMALGIAGFLIAFHMMGWSRAAMIGFDIGATVFLLSCLPLLGREPDAMRESAERNDANRATLLAITGIVCSVILVAIAEELSARGATSPATVALIIGTLLLAWLFSNMTYALHYAHLFYSRNAKGGDSGGIGFPGDDEPNYWDFIYFAFTLGMTFQTSDVEIGSRSIRRVAILHSFAAFVFNIGVLAFTINVLGG
ncbi:MULTISPECIES: DUF1345 domain-containing protein [unclassified Sphingomonas]|uniref:DUF1345 domain-containing protein n=1 Tax=unclassified Sphingomonas TaxID=196159 RepID=UPI0006FAE8DF|nr:MULTISPECIES: DUF1345 domain-containing protein [unclassified Sphingomonas]KQX24828.1 hypothetical protein ASD17_24220 [Sphingomonas sp. Root1294]KQY69816.1 hypothetical protein ASD39_24335 [Sphingomonas sp. Root50]KRB93930.1 hypothetical protein ASE22_24725 [Sphingomonas sp. Root720]